ncbi:MAG: hypothetical protein R8K54_07725 [Mariprofundaceae bacterium]
MNRLQHSSRLLGSLLLLAVSLLMLSTYSDAATDPRMVVEIVADEEGKVPAVEDAIQQALPVLWDRIVEDFARPSLSDKIKATPFLFRVLPHPNGVQVTFNQQRVWQYLDQHGIAYLREAPRLNLQIQMINQNDMSMPKTAEALQAFAQGTALARGIVLDEKAPMLIANWRWVDATQVYLSVQGNSELAEFSEMRTVEAGDPLVQLQAWMEELLLKVRNTHPEQTDVMADMPIKQMWDNGIELILTIEQPASLSEQVVLEDALRQNSKVSALIPTHLSATSRQYRMLLNGEDDTWITAWFQRRGMQVSPTPSGWLVQ